MIKLTMRYGDLRFGTRNSSGPGPVKTYFLTPEELAEVHRKYGPPRRRKKKSFYDLYTKTKPMKGGESSESSASV